MDANEIVANMNRYVSVPVLGMSSWDHFFLSLATFVSGKSKDMSTKVGAVIVDDRNNVVSSGWNDLPRRVRDSEERRARPEKYVWTEHAERNAIYNAAAIGAPLVGCTIYSTMFPCCDCARAIIQSGVSELVTVEPDWHDEHRKATSRHAESLTMLREAGVAVRFVPAVL